MTFSSAQVSPSERISPFPELSRVFQVCYLSRALIDQFDHCVYFPVECCDDREKNVKLAPVKTEELFKTLGLASRAEQENLTANFFGRNEEGKLVLLTWKFSRHKPELFQTLIGHTKTSH